MNDFYSLLPLIHFSEEEQLQFIKKIWDLLKAQAERYNGFDSTSMTVEKAQDLLESIIYSLSLVISTSGLSAEDVLQQDFSVMLGQARKLIENNWKNLNEEWARICIDAPEINNIYYVSTLKSIGNFFKKYDFYYAAHQIPCSIDYPLVKAVPDNLKGISYIENYLASIKIENEFVKKVTQKKVLELLQEMTPRYEENYFNICEAVFLNALGKEMIQQDLDSLLMNEDDIDSFVRKYLHKRTEELADALSGAAVSLFRRIGFDKEYLPYFSGIINSLAQRIISVNDMEYLKNIFIVKR